MTSSGLDPQDQELIAAFVDQRMSSEEREAFMARLDREERLYEVFVETVRYRDQESGRQATVVEHPAARRGWPRFAVAAALAAAALAPVMLLNLPAARYAQRLVADGLLGDVLEENWLDKGWKTMRGGPSPGSGEFDTAFKLGVRQVDLEVALRLGRAEDVQQLNAEIEYLLAGLEMGEVMRLRFAKVVDPVAGADDVLERLESFDEELREFLGEASAPYDLGQWTDAGLLAARSGNTDLLGSRGFRRALDEFPRQEWAESDDALAGQLETVERLLEAPEGLNLERLAAAFEAILKVR